MIKDLADTNLNKALKTVFRIKSNGNQTMKKMQPSTLFHNVKNATH